MNLQEALAVRPGITAVVGSGGKSTLLRELAHELADTGAKVILATTTHFLPFEGIETLIDPADGDVATTLNEHGVACVAGRAAEGQKLTAPAAGLEPYAGLADYLLVEADGSKRLPLKAHAAWEPVVPASARRILVVGASGFGKPIDGVVHRPEIFCRLAGCDPSDDATPELVARAIAAESLANVVAVNQAETPEALEAARELAAHLDQPVYAGSFQAHDLEPLN